MSHACCCGSSVGSRAAEYFGNGYHCAEAVASAVLEKLGLDPTLARMHATPFGGGMGRSFCETCGALSGGLIAIGHVHGRKARGDDWTGAALMGSELRDAMIEAYGATGCGALLDRFGQDGDAECARLVGRMAEAAAAILDRASAAR